MMKIKNKILKSLKPKFLTACISAFSTGMVLSSVVQASDIDVYQQARSGDITLMFLLDLSGSMETRDSGQTQTRIQLVRSAMIDVLQGNATKQIIRIDDDKIIGLSTFENNTGTVRIPARRLGDMVTGNITQRQLLINTVNGLTTNRGRTPTANAYADVASYLMGTTTKNLNRSGFSSASTAEPTRVRNADKYIQPPSFVQTDEQKKCSGQGVYVLTDGEPNQSSVSIAGTLMKSALNNNNFNCSNSLLPEVNNPNYGTEGAWSCIGNLSQRLLDKANNPAGLVIKTAVVGFGGDFNGLTSYNKALTQEQNLNNINNATINSNIANDIRNAARWGIYGGGGWYSGKNSQDVVDSVNEFINSLSTEIPAVTTGSSTIARDALNPSALQKEAYFPQFQPTPDKTYQLWSGNLKKYNVVSGILKDKGGNSITDTKGKIVDNYDLWAKAVTDANREADENTPGSTKFALIGGAKSKLELRTTGTTENRKLLTNRIINGSGTSVTFGNSTTLRQVKSTDLTDANYKSDASRGYLISLLGYNVDAKNPSAINLTTSAELRQIGAVMHSSPMLLTNKGTITYENNVLGSKDREDYVMFGTTQGLLHVVDAKTGKEKFAFVPNEMVENQKDAFLKFDTTSGGLNKLFYGVDGPWTTYSEYVVDSNGTLTVGTGVDYQQGMQMAYGGLRMGGRSYYALDLTNMNDPKLKFQISPADQKVYYDGSSKSFSELKYMGQSWSKPTIAWVKWGNTRKRVMLVGGGYDAGGDDGDARTNGVKGAYAGYESNSYDQKNKKGGGVYMFDADNGSLLWWASANASATSTATTNDGVISTKDDNLKYSVVSEIRAEDRNSDGLADHLYFGDLGGQLFRIDLDNTAKTLGTFAKAPRMLLNLNKTSGTSPRFYEMPAFSIYDKAGTTFAVISIGSGNRSNPLIDYTVGTMGQDYDAVYNIYDKDATARDLFKSGYTYLTNTISLLTDLGEVTQTNRNDNTILVAPYTANGWYFKFKSQKLQSAKVFATPTVLNSRMLVTTFDGSKDGLSGDCGAGVKGASFLSQFCMPFGQCVKATGNNPPPTPECSSGDGCSIGPGIQGSVIVDEKTQCDPATDPNKCEDKDIPKPEDNPNANYCITTGNRGATIQGGVISTGNSHICLVPQRWFEYSNK